MFRFISNVYGNTEKQSCVVLCVMKYSGVCLALPSDHWLAHQRVRFPKEQAHGGHRAAAVGFQPPQGSSHVRKRVRGRSQS